MMRTFGRGLAALAAVFALGACQVTVGLTTILEEDGSGTFTLAMGADAELVELREQEPGGLRALEEPFERLESEGWTISRTEPEEGGLRFEATQAFEDLAEFETILDELSQARSSADTGELGQVEFDIALDQDVDRVQTKSTFAGTFDTGAIRELIPDPAFLAELRRLVAFEIAVEMPGDPVVHAGEATIEDGRVVWRPQLGDTMEFEATSTLRDPGLFVFLLLGGLALGLAALVIVARGRRKARRFDELSAIRIEEATVGDEVIELAEPETDEGAQAEPQRRPQAPERDPFD